jgi:hypothetical protein
VNEENEEFPLGTIKLGTTGTITATGTVTNDGTIETATTDADTLATLVGFGGGGDVVLTGAVIDVDATLTLNTNLEIDTDGSITFKDNFAGTAFSGPGEVTISGTGALNLGSGVTSLGNTVTVGSGITGTVTTATESAAVLNTLLGQTNKITANASNTTNANITVPQDVTLTLAENIVLQVGGSNTLTVNGIITVGTGTSGITNGNIITIGENGSISDYTAVTGGTVKLYDTDQLSALLVDATGIVSGIVEIAATTATLGMTEIKSGVTLKVPSNKILNVNGPITGTAITNDGTINLVDTGSIHGVTTKTNNNTINTTTSDSAVLPALVEFGGGGKVVWNGAGTITPSGGLTTLTQDLVIGPNATLGLGENTISAPAKVTNNGKITTGTNDETVLRDLVGISGTGTVEWNGTTEISLASSDLTLATQDLEIGPNATLNIAEFTLANGGTGTVTNNGKIKTAAATGVLLQPILNNFNGTIEITATTVTVAKDTELTVPADTTLTVPSGKTLTLGATGGGAKLILTDETSELVLTNGGILKAAHKNSTITGIAESAGVTISGSYATATFVSDGPPLVWTVTRHC